jgi:hypothetical protein
VGKCCTNVPRSLRAYVMVDKATYTCICEKKDTTHVCSARCAINECDTHAYVHADIPNSNTLVCLARIPTFIQVHNVIVYTMHKLAPQLHTYANRLCTALHLQ